MHSITRDCPVALERERVTRPGWRDEELTSYTEPSGMTVTELADGEFDVDPGDGGPGAAVKHYGDRANGTPFLICNCPASAAYCTLRGKPSNCSHTHAVERFLSRREAERRRVPSPWKIGETVTLLRDGAPSVTGTVETIYPSGSVVLSTPAGWHIQLGERAVKGGTCDA